MNWTVFIIEAVILCAVFHLATWLIVRLKPEQEVYSYPPAVLERWIELGKVPRREKPNKAALVRGKAPAALVIGALLGLLAYWLNGCRSFLSGFLVSYALWLIVDWYDALILDCLWFAHSRACVLPGTEDLGEAYRDYGFYIRGSLTGMVIGLPVCLLIGLAVQIIGWL